MKGVWVSLAAIVAVAVVALVGCSAAAPQAQFPEKGKAVTIDVGFSAGGSSDLQVRTTAPFLEKELGVPVQVVNKAGANSQVASVDLAKAKGDGYSLMQSNDVNIIANYVNPAQQAPFGRKDFMPLVLQAEVFPMWAVKADAPWRTGKELIEAARAKPGEIKFGTAGLLSDTHLAALQVEKAAGVKLNIVHFDGAAPAITALLGGHVDVASGSVVVMTGHLKSGAVRVLGVTSKDRSKLAADIPTFKEQGYDAVLPSPRGYLAPPGTPKAVLDTLGKAFKKVMDAPETQQKMAELGMDPSYLGPDDYTAYWDKEEAVLKELVKQATADQAGKK